MEILGLWQLFKNMDWVSQIISLTLVTFLFVLTITVAVWRILTLHFKTKQVKRALLILHNVNTFDDLLEKSRLLHANVVGNMLSYSLTELKRFLKAYDNSDVSINDQDWQIFQSKLYAIVDSEVEKEEVGLPFLATIAAISPLMGLFGTVWGLVDSFLSVGQQVSSDMAHVGKGIAEALLTTIAGLFVAIPALVLYNYAVSRVRAYENLLMQVVDSYMVVLRLAVERKQKSNQHVYTSGSYVKENEL